MVAKHTLVVTIALGGLLLNSDNLRAGGIPADTLKAIKAATVFVKVEFTAPGLPRPVPATGSGFVLLVDGETAYIVTNDHVITPPADLPQVRRLGAPELVFNSGTKNERSARADILATDPSRDLAILRVSNLKQPPAAIPRDPKLEVIETMGVFIFGFPFGEALSTTRGNPAMTIGKGSVSSIREDEFGRVKVVQIDGDLNPGNSGGPVVDDKGRLVGIAVAKIDRTRIGLAIPAAELAEMLLGRVGGITFDTNSTDDGAAEIQVRARLIDPMQKMKGVAIHYLPTAQLKEKIVPDKEGRFPPLPGAAKVELSLNKDLASGKFTYSSKEKKEVGVTFQTAYVNAEGQTRFTQPAEFTINFSLVTVARFAEKLTETDPRDRLRRNCPAKMHEVKLLADKTYIIDMVSASPQKLDPFLRLENGQGKELLWDDDSAGNLNARMIFTPAADDIYRIVATSFGPGAGAYTLSVREGNPSSEALRIGRDGLQLRSGLAANDPRDPSVRNAPAKAYYVALSAGRSYRLDLLSNQFDPFLRVEDTRGRTLAQDDDSGGNLNSRILFRPPSDAVYRLIATSFDGRTGDFALLVQQVNPGDKGRE